jgi:hypothetical protein
MTCFNDERDSALERRTMKRRITLSLVLTLSVLLSLVSLPSTAQGAPGQRFRFPTGIITPGIGQTLRVTVVGRSDTIRVRFAWMKYMAPECIGMPAVCRHTVESQGATPLVILNGDGDDALSFDVPGDGNGVNVVVVSNNQDVRVNAMIIDSAGNINAFWLPGNY